MSRDNQHEDWQGHVAQEERDRRMDDAHIQGYANHPGSSSEHYENEQRDPGLPQGQLITDEDNNFHGGPRNCENNAGSAYPPIKRGTPRTIIEAMAKQFEEETVSLLEDGIETEMMLADTAVEVLSNDDPDTLYTLEKYDGLELKS